MQPGTAVPTDTAIDRFGTVTNTSGPRGEQPTPISDVELTEAQKATIKNGNHKAAILWHELSGWTKALQTGIEDEFAELGVDIVAKTDAKFDAVTQANQIETTLALTG